EGGGGLAKWATNGVAGLSFELTRAMRDVLLGTDPPVNLTRRAVAHLEKLRTDLAADTVHPAGLLITRTGGDVRWWTWAGYRANATLTSTLSSVTDPVQRPTDLYVRLREDLTPDMWKAARAEAPLVLPDIDPRAVRGLKFSAALPEHLATATVATRLADLPNAEKVLAEPTRFTITHRS
ncbi:DEAD/DEAH box helicase, partial [Actinomadura kijaniata]